MIRAWPAVLAALTACGLPNAEQIRAADLADVQAVFEGNLQAIRDHAVDRYLSFYLPTDDLIAVSPAGVVRGYDRLATSHDSEPVWPDSIVAGQPTFVWLAPGAVYVVYDYVARQAGLTSSGWSERIFVKTGEGWKIAVTTAVPVTP